MMRAVIFRGTYLHFFVFTFTLPPWILSSCSNRTTCFTAGVSTPVHVMISSTTVSIFYFNRMKNCLQPKLLPKTNNGLHQHTYIIICKYMYSDLLLTRNKTGECRSYREESGRLQCMNKKIALKEESKFQSSATQVSLCKSNW